MPPNLRGADWDHRRASLPLNRVVGSERIIRLQAHRPGADGSNQSTLAKVSRELAPKGPVRLLRF